MRILIMAAALSLASGPGLAASITCDKPEYLQLKTADKAELRQEFCRTTRMNDLNMRLRQGTETEVSELRRMGADATEAVNRSAAELSAAESCSKAAAEYAGALERRFKSKPPASRLCLSPGGI